MQVDCWPNYNNEIYNGHDIDRNSNILKNSFETPSTKMFALVDYSFQYSVFNHKQSAFRYYFDCIGLKMLQVKLFLDFT